MEYLIQSVVALEYYDRFTGREYVIEYSQGDDYSKVSELKVLGEKLTTVLAKYHTDMWRLEDDKHKHNAIMLDLLKQEVKANKISIIDKIKSLLKPAEIALMIIAFIILSHKMDAQIIDGWIVNDNCESLAIEVEEMFKIPKELTIAIYRHESGWGKSNVAKSKNNYFGIMERHLNDGVVTYSYKEFSSKVHCFLYWGDMIRNGGIYPECLDQRIDNIVRCIHSKNYSTDPNWSTAVINLINQGI